MRNPKRVASSPVVPETSKKQAEEMDVDEEGSDKVIKTGPPSSGARTPVKSRFADANPFEIPDPTTSATFKTPETPRRAGDRSSSRTRSRSASSNRNSGGLRQKSIEELLSKLRASQLPETGAEEKDDEMSDQSEAEDGGKPPTPQQKTKDWASMAEEDEAFLNSTSASADSQKDGDDDTLEASNEAIIDEPLEADPQSPQAQG